MNDSPVIKELTTNSGDATKARLVANMQPKLQQMLEVLNNTNLQEEDVNLIISNSFIIKGRADGLGYKLLASVADSLCKYSENYLHKAQANDMVIQKHLAIMELVIKNNISGDGGKLGRELLESLQLLIAKYHSAADMQ